MGKQEENVLDEIKKLSCLKGQMRLTQTDIADYIGVSSDKLAQYEIDDMSLTQLEKKQIENGLKSLYRDMTLDFKIDYLRVSFKHHDIDRVYEQILGIEKRYFEEINKRFYGYLQVFQLGHIMVMISAEDDERGILVEMSGQGCEQFSRFLNFQNRTWLGFLRTCLNEKARFPRIDLACDDYIEYVNIKTAWNKVQRNEFITPFRNVKPEYDLSVSKKSDNSISKMNDGLSIYFGSKQSDMYIVFYEKNKELAKKMKLNLSDIAVKNRYEIRFKNDYAYGVVEQLLEYDDISEIVLGVLYDKLNFLTRDKEKTWKNWERLLGAVRRHKLVTKVSDDEFIQLMRKKNYLINQAYSSVLVFKGIDNVLGTNILNEIEHTVLNKDNPKRDYLIEIATTSMKDMIVSGLAV